MIDSFVEGVRSLTQVCHLVILMPVALTIVAARGHRRAVVGGVLGIVLGGWIFVSGWVDVTDVRLRVSALAVALAIGTLMWSRLDGTQQDRSGQGDGSGRSWLPAGVTAGVALVVAQWWRPCVGVELGSILTDAPKDPIGQLPATIGFMLAMSVPLVLLGLAYAAWAPSDRPLAVTSSIGASLTVLLAGSVVAGQHGEIVSRLFEWSQ